MAKSRDDVGGLTMGRTDGIRESTVTKYQSGAIDSKSKKATIQIVSRPAQYNRDTTRGEIHIAYKLIPKHVLLAGSSVLSGNSRLLQLRQRVHLDDAKSPAPMINLQIL